MRKLLAGALVATSLAGQAYAGAYSDNTADMYFFAAADRHPSGLVSRMRSGERRPLFRRLRQRRQDSPDQDAERPALHLCSASRARWPRRFARLRHPARSEPLPRDHDRGRFPVAAGDRSECGGSPGGTDFCPRRQRLGLVQGAFRPNRHRRERKPRPNSGFDGP